MNLAFRPPWLALASALPLLLAACHEPDPTVERPSRSRLSAQLARSASCAELEEALREEARAHVEARAYELVATHGSYYGGPIYANGGIDAGAAVGAAPAGPTADTRPSETNVQVAGVDELDFVDTTGEKTFLLHHDTLRVLASSPATELREVGTLALGGSGLGLMVAGDRAVVVTQTSGYGYSGDPLAVADGAVDAGAPSPAPDAAAPEPDAGEVFGLDAGPTDAGVPPGIRIFVLDVSSDVPVVVSDRVLQGSLVGARRHDGVVRVVVRRTPVRAELLAPDPVPFDADGQFLSAPAYTARVVAWRRLAFDRIDSLALEALLPQDFVHAGSTWEPTPIPCGSVYLQDRGAAAEGFVTIAGFDVHAPASFASTTVVGDSSFVHASRDALVLAYSDAWNSSILAIPGPATTVLRRFGLEGSDTPYEASGEVDGTIGSPYWIDATAERIRVVTLHQELGTSGFVLAEPTLGPSVGTIASSPAAEGTTVRVLKNEGHTLVEAGSSPPLAPGETVQAVRFVGSKAYVVTFRRVDPLFVVDLSDDVPRVLGELTMPGFSTYVHPLDATHLLTTGFAADELGRTTGLAIRVFDVSDPAAPALLHELALDAWSSATYEPHDFVFDAGSGLLTLPMTVASPTYASVLAVFRVSVADGIVAVGNVDHAAFATPCPEATWPLPYDAYWACDPYPQLLRGVFLADGLLAIGDTAVTAHRLPELGAPLATVELPPLAFSYGFPGWF